MNARLHNNSVGSPPETWQSLKSASISFIILIDAIISIPLTIIFFAIGSSKIIEVNRKGNSAHYKWTPIVFGAGLLIFFWLFISLGTTCPPSPYYAKNKKTRSQIKDLARMMTEYETRCQDKIADDDDLRRVLSSSDLGCREWTKPFNAKALLVDAWGNQLFIRNVDGHRSIATLGRDGKTGGDCYNQDFEVEISPGLNEPTLLPSATPRATD